MKFRKWLSLFLCLSVALSIALPFKILASDEYDTAIAANNAVIGTEGVTWGNGDLYDGLASSVTYRLTTAAQAVFTFKNINTKKFMLRTAQHNGLNNLCSFEVSFDGENFVAAEVTAEIKETYKNAKGWMIKKVHYTSVEFENPIKAVRIKKAASSNIWYFNVIDLQYNDIPYTYNTQVLPESGIFDTDSAVWEKGDLLSDLSGRLPSTEKEIKIRYNNLNCSRFMLQAAIHSGLSSDLLSFEVSYDGATFNSVSVLVKTLEKYTSSLGEIKLYQFSSEEFSKPVKAIRITRKTCYNKWYINLGILKCEEVPREYNTALTADRGVFVSGAGSWQSSELFRDEIGYTPDSENESVIDYTTDSAAYFKYTAALKDGAELTFEISYDGTIFEKISTSIKELDSYTDSDGKTVKELEYLSYEYSDPINIIRVKKSEGSAALIKLDYFAVNTNKAELSLLLEQAKKITNKNYSQDRLDALSEAIAEAEEAYNTFIINQSAIKAAADNLRNAAANLYSSRVALADGFSYEQQGDKIYYLQTDDYKLFTTMQNTNVSTSGGLNWWANIPTVTWGSLAMLRVASQKMYFYRDSKTTAPAVAIKIDKAGYIKAEYDSETNTVYYAKKLSNVKEIGYNEVFYVNEGDYVIFALKAGLISGNAVCPAIQPAIRYVEYVAAEGINLVQENIDLYIGDTENIAYVFSPMDTNNYTGVEFRSSDENVAMVSDDGTVVGVGGGTATIILSAGDITAECTVNVISPLEDIEIKSATVLALGGSEQLEVIYVPYHTTDDRTVIWESSDEEIVTVHNGRIEGKKLGSATITAKVGEKTAVCEVLVVIPLLSVELNKTSIELNVGDTFNLEFIKNPHNTTIAAEPIWQSTNKGIVTVDSNGKITAVSGGKAVVVVTIDGKSAICNVTVKSELESIQLNKSRIMLVKDDTDSLIAECYPFYAGSPDEIVWTSSNPKAVGIENGVVTALGRGMAVITAEAKGKSAVCLVAVVEAEQDIITFESLDKDDILNIQAVTSPPTGEKFIWIFVPAVICVLSAAVLLLTDKKIRKSA